jgi:hypothetical protein
MRSLFVLVFCTLCIGGCATKGRGNTTVGIDDSKFNKTMVGALAGAAGGASFGVLAADNAAEGVAIGAISGGIIGAGVGAILAKNDSENDSLNEKFIQQQEKIKQQERDIDYLRSRDAEKVPKRSESNGVGEEDLSLKESTGRSEKSSGAASNDRPPTVDLSGDDPKSVKKDAAITTPVTTAKEPTARGSMSEKYPYSDARPSGSRQSRGVAGDAVIVAGVAGAATVASKSASSPTSTGESSAKAAKAAAPKAELAKPDTVKSEIAPTLKKVEPTPTSVAPPAGQAGCKEAVKEAERGLKSSSDADRLFYLRRASRLCPGEPTYHVELGRMLSSLGKYNEAKQELKHALTLDPKNQTARDELGILENSSGRK